MNCCTGEIYPNPAGLGMFQLAESVGANPADLKEVTRPLTVREQKKMQIDKYAPCGCGSGKKFKFCCYKK